MSMMGRRGAGYGAIAGAPADPRFPELPDSVRTVWPAAESRRRIEEYAPQRFSGYLAIRRARGEGTTEGVILFHNGQPIGARVGGSAADDTAALGRLLADDSAAEVRCAAHALNEGVALALSATFRTPRLTQPLAADSGEVALLLRDLAGVRHSGVVQLSAADGRVAAPWVRILMYEGTFLGVYSGGDRQIKASLADVGDVLTEQSPRLTLFAMQGTPQPLALPSPTMATSLPPAAVSGGSLERDELLEADLVWFLSRFEQVFGRRKEQPEPQADLLRAFGELTNDLAGFVAALQTGGTATAAAAREVVADELARARVAGALSVDLKLGKSGIDAVGVGKAYTACPQHGHAAAEYFSSASAGLLALIERLLEQMLAAFHDGTAAGFAREGCETLLREVRHGLAELPAD